MIATISADIVRSTSMNTEDLYLAVEGNLDTFLKSVKEVK